MEIGNLRKKVQKGYFFLERKRRSDPSSFQGVCIINDVPFVEDLVHVNIFPYEIHIVDGQMIRELAQRNVGKLSNTVQLVQLLCYNSHICYLFNNKARFEKQSLFIM